MALSWLWEWNGLGVEKSGSADGKTFTIKKLPIDEDATSSSTYGLSLTLTDELGASVSATYTIDAIQPPEPPIITSISGPATVEETAPHFYSRQRSRWRR